MVCCVVVFGFGLCFGIVGMVVCYVLVEVVVVLLVVIWYIGCGGLVLWMDLLCIVGFYVLVCIVVGVVLWWL